MSQVNRASCDGHPARGVSLQILQHVQAAIGKLMASKGETDPLEAAISTQYRMQLVTMPSFA